MVVHKETLMKWRVAYLLCNNWHTHGGILTRYLTTSL